MASRVRFLQLSDVHFGASLTGGRLHLSASAVQTRVAEKRDAFARAMDLVIERELDGVLLPGDLFDDESIDVDTLNFVIHHLERVRRPVFVAPGNHDPYGGASPYAGDAARNARGLRWPGNVHVFAHEDFRALSWPQRPEITVVGCGVASNVPRQERRLADRIPRPETELSILLFHGSRDDGEWLQSHKATHPFSRQELLAQDFDWTALGHYHHRQILADDEPRPRAAYAGCTVATGLDEIGAKGALVVDLSPDGCEVEFVELDPRQVRRVVCDVSGARFQEAAAEIVLAALDGAHAHPQDLVHLQVRGRRARGLDLGFLDELADRYFHLRVDRSDLLPDLDLDRYPSLEEATSTEERFVAQLRPALEGPDADLHRRALLYGLDALETGRLAQRYEA
jgi:DNA repair exonuclease SbcCD nuclease subunit